MTASLTLAASISVLLAISAVADEFSLILPTQNDALLRGTGPQYYMHTNRAESGGVSKPWQGGTYGFSRNPTQLGGSTLMTRFHEGMDVRPLLRDAAGEPLDDILAVAEGRVVHVNLGSNQSNYGRYIVLEHQVERTEIYTLYAHIAQSFVQKGDRVKQGQAIARMGYTGRGLDRERAHLHFEICLRLSREFDAWHTRYYPRDTNWHGEFNGINLAGLDPARFYREQQKNPQLRVAEFLRTEEPAYRLRLPLKLRPHLLNLYPWLVTGKPGPGDRSWEITFAAGDVPMEVRATATASAGPEVAWVNSGNGLPVNYLSKGKVSWEKGRGYYLTSNGLGFVDLLTEGMLVYVER